MNEPIFNWLKTKFKQFFNRIYPNQKSGFVGSIFFFKNLHWIGCEIVWSKSEVTLSEMPNKCAGRLSLSKKNCFWNYRYCNRLCNRWRLQALPDDMQKRTFRKNCKYIYKTCKTIGQIHRITKQTLPGNSLLSCVLSVG